MSKVKKQKNTPIDILAQKMTKVNKITLTYGLSDCASLADIQDLIGKLIIQYGPSAKLMLDAGYNVISEILLVEQPETDDEYAQRLKSLIEMQTEIASRATEKAEQIAKNLDLLNDAYTKVLSKTTEKK